MIDTEPIDHMAMIRAMMEGGRRWGERDRAFGSFMIRTLSEPVPTRPQMREGPRRPDACA